MLLKGLFISALCCIAYADYHDLHQNSNPIPYNFGYNVQGHGGGHFRKEQGNGQGQVQGSYGYTDENGILREVNYVADHNGFRAQVKTNEPGTSNYSPADVNLYSNAQHNHHFFGNNEWNGF